MEQRSDKTPDSDRRGLARVLPLDTQRLRIREFEPCDENDLYELHRDRRVTRHAGGPKSKAQSAESLQRIIGRTRTTGFGALALEHLESGRVIGWCGVQPMRAEAVYEVIYALNRHCWGQGLACEAANAVMRETFVLDDVEITHLYALVYPQNVRSILVLERLGMRFVEHRFDEETKRHACLYQVSKKDFMQYSERPLDGLVQSSRSK